MLIGTGIGYAIKPTGISQEEHKKIVGERDVAVRERDKAVADLKILNDKLAQLETQMKTQNETYKMQLKTQKDAYEVEIKNLEDQIKNLETINTETMKPKNISKLHVVGNKLVDEEGNIRILRGVAVLDVGHKTYRYPDLLKFDYDEIKNGWKANVVRLLVHPKLWETQKANEIKWVDYQVKLAKERNMYLILCYHAVGDPGKPNPTDMQNPDIEIALDFWVTMASMYANEKHVMYEIFNEPVCDSWAIWKAYAQQLVDTIRKNATDTLLIVGGIDWGYDISGAIKNPINDKNVAYSTHPYPIKDALERVNRSPYGCPEKWQAAFGDTKEVFPVIATEFSFRDINDNTWNTKIWGADERWGRAIIDFLEERGISWIVWHFSPFYGPELLENMEEIGTTGKLCDGTVECYKVTESGAFFKQEMIRLNGN